MLDVEKFTVFKSPRSCIHHLICLSCKVTGDEKGCLTRRYKRPRSLPAPMDVEVDPLNAHATAKVLSQNMATCLQQRSEITISNPSQPKTMPVSSRLLIVRSPFGLSAMIKWALMSSGHSSGHAQNFVASKPGVLPSRMRL